MRNKNKTKKEIISYPNRSFSINAEYEEVVEILDGLPRGTASKYICLAILTYNKIVENPEWLTKEVINPGSLNELAQSIDPTTKVLLPVRNEEILRHVEMEKTFSEMKEMMDRFNGYFEQVGFPPPTNESNQVPVYSEVKTGQQELGIDETTKDVAEEVIEKNVAKEPTKPKSDKKPKDEEIAIEEIDASAFSGPIISKKPKSKRKKNAFGAMNVLGESKE